MSFSDYLATTQVFTTQQMLDATGASPSARVALSRAVKSGKAHKVRSGLYISQAGKYQETKADPYLIAQTMRPDSVFVYHSALELHGLAHTMFFTVQFMTEDNQVRFDYDGIQYHSYPLRKTARSELLRAKAFGSASVTTREQTLVDCMAKIGAAGGLEEVLRSFAGLPYVDLDAVFDCLAAYSPSVAARVGWYRETNQERWSVPDHMLDLIEAMIPTQASYKLDTAYSHFVEYDSRWHVNLPVSTAEIETWLEA
jgi:predicted transcriptional regulator of viral defense system